MDAVISVLRVVFAKRHGGHRLCNVINCTHHVFRRNMCRSHYSSTNKSSTIMNKSIPVSTTTVSQTKSGTLTTNSGNAMEIDIVIEKVMDFVGMGNWEQVHTFAAVCKCWRHSSLSHLSNIGKVPMDGGRQRRLNISAFLGWLQLEHFRNVGEIYIPCGETKGLFMNDIKQACPSVQIIFHSKWLMMNGSMEEIQEGEGRHPCYRVYRHDMPFTEGTNVWVQFKWDKKFKLVSESLFVAPAFLRTRKQIRTSFFRY